MSRSRRTFKLQIMITNELLERLDNVAQKLSMTRSAFCANAISQSVYSYEKSLALTDDVGSLISAEIEKLLVEQLKKDD